MYLVNLKSCNLIINLCLNWFELCEIMWIMWNKFCMFEWITKTFELIFYQPNFSSPPLLSFHSYKWKRELRWDSYILHSPCLHRLDWTVWAITDSHVCFGNFKSRALHSLIVSSRYSVPGDKLIWVDLDRVGFGGKLRSSLIPINWIWIELFTRRKENRKWCLPFIKTLIDNRFK